MESEIPTPDTQFEKDTVQIGVIGMGDMGRFYAKRIGAAGWKQLSGRARSVVWRGCAETMIFTKIEKKLKFLVKVFVICRKDIKLKKGIPKKKKKSLRFHRPPFFWKNANPHLFIFFFFSMHQG